MGRLRKLRIEATESANKVLSEGKIEVKPTKTEDSEQKTEDFGSLQDFYTLIESNRSNTVTEEEESDEGEFELDYCKNCMQMKNHIDGVCQKCKKEKVEKTVVTEEMKAVVDKMKYILNYDLTKTRKENINELHILDPEGGDDDFKKDQEKRKDGPYEKASKEELRKAIHAKQRAEAGLDSDEPTFSMPVVDVSGTDRGAAQDKGITFGDSGMDINIDSIEIEDIDRDDYPRFSDAYASYAEWEDGTELTDDELDELTDNQYDLINRLALETLQGE